MNHLVGGAITILKNMKVNFARIIPYMKWKKHVPNHQPVYVHRHASKFGSITRGQVGQVNT